MKSLELQAVAALEKWKCEESPEATKAEKIAFVHGFFAGRRVWISAETPPSHDKDVLIATEYRYYVGYYHLGDWWPSPVEALDFISFGDHDGDVKAWSEIDAPPRSFEIPEKRNINGF